MGGLRATFLSSTIIRQPFWVAFFDVFYRCLKKNVLLVYRIKRSVRKIERFL